MANKRKKIDWLKVEELCAYGCTAKEVAHFLDMSADTLERGCKRDFKKTWTEMHEKWYYSKFRVSLRKRMHEKAMRGDTVMLIFMGKNHLGMSDAPQQNVIESREPVQYSFMNNFFPQQPAPSPQIVNPPQTFLLPQGNEEHRNVAVFSHNQFSSDNETDSVLTEQ